MLRNCQRDTLFNKAYPRSTLIYLVQKDNRLGTYDLDTLKRDLVIKPSHSYDVHILAKSDCQQRHELTSGLKGPCFRLWRIYEPRRDELTIYFSLNTREFFKPALLLITIVRQRKSYAEDSFIMRAKNVHKLPGTGSANSSKRYRQNAISEDL